MKPLRICHVIHNTEFGGTETMLLQVLKQLAGKHEMSVVSLMRCGEIGKRIRALGIPVYALNCAKDRKPRPQGLIELVRRIRTLKPEVVQTWAYHADLCGGVAARLATQAAVVWNIRHTTLDPKIDSKNVLRSARLCARLSNWVPDRILLNAHAAVDVHAREGYKREKMEVVPNGFDLSRFRKQPAARDQIRNELRIPTSGQLVGMCGRFHPHKGQSEFVKVAKRIAKQNPNAYFLIAGNQCSEENVELTTWIENAELQDRFRLLGSRNDIPELLNAMDLYLLPSLTEGMPNVVGEAMACGVPVVATDVGDAKFLLGGHGTVVPAEDIPTMTDAANAVLARPVTARAELGQQARKRIEDEFEIGVIASKYVSTWRSVLEARNEGVSTSYSGPATIPFPTQRSTTNEATPYRPKLVHVTTIPMTQWLFLRGQNAFMNEQGFEVHSVASSGRYMPMLQERDPVTTHEVSITRQITPFRDAISAYRLWKLFRQLRPEIVQLSTPKAALLGAIAAKAARVPVRIYQVRGLSSESEQGAKRHLFQRLERFTARLCNAHLVNANSLLEYAQQAKILRSGRVAGSGMSNGVDIDRFDPETVRMPDMTHWDRNWNSSTGPVIGYIGRLTRDKGLEELYASWTSLRNEFPNARLLLVGPWESENAVSPKCREGLKNDRRVIMTGTQDDVVPFYKCMDVFAFPSHGTEGFPNAPMEAASMRLPVIATRVVGCVDAVVDGVTGTMITPRSQSQLESALRAYLGDEQLRNQHGTEGRERILRGFAPVDLWNDFHDYYIHLLRREGLVLPTPERVLEPLRKAA